MRWLVTGGCGFIGANLIADLRATGGHEVRVLDDGSAAADSLRACGVNPGGSICARPTCATTRWSTMRPAGST